jgi:DnaJ-class molecular chaperone
MDTTIECTVCVGSGFSVNIESSCPTCEGTGEVIEKE